MKKQILFAIVAVNFAAFGTLTHAQVVNIAPDGTAILGYNDGTNLNALGTSYQHSNTGGNYPDINDGVTVANAGTYTSTDDTYGANEPYSYVGIAFTPSQLASFQGQSITSVNMYFYIFIDGGWFGQRAQGLVNGDIPSSELVAPQLQITTNGTTWTNVATTTSYTESVANGGLAGQASGNSGPIAFVLDTPISLTNLEGIRLIGLGGGTASDGFLGVNEFQVDLPEPSTYALLFAGAGVLALGLRRRRLI